MSEANAASPEGVVRRLGDFRRSGASVAAEEMIALLESLEGNDGFTLSDWYEVVEFAANQEAIWQCAWLFSTAGAPDRGAEHQMQQWSELWRSWAESLCKRVPAARDALAEYREDVAVRRALELRLSRLQGRAIARTGASVMSSAALLLARVGLHGLGRSLYRAALYPRGSVGRASV